LSEGIAAMKIWPFDIAAEASNARASPLWNLTRRWSRSSGFAMRRPRYGDYGRLHGLWTCAFEADSGALKPFDVAWLEEPVRYNEADAMAELARHTISYRRQRAP